METCRRNRLQSFLSYDISAYLFLCLHLFNISVRLFSMLLSLCNTIFCFSFKHNEHLLLLMLYAWCLPKISHVMFALCLLSFILQNSLDSSVSDLRFLWLNDFLSTEILNKYRHKNKYGLISYDSKDYSRFLLKVSTKRFPQNYCFQESGWLPLPVAHQITGHTDFPWKHFAKTLMWRHIIQKIP